VLGPDLREYVSAVRKRWAAAAVALATAGGLIPNFLPKVPIPAALWWAAAVVCLSWAQYQVALDWKHRNSAGTGSGGSGETAAIGPPTVSQTGDVYIVAPQGADVDVSVRWPSPPAPEPPPGIHDREEQEIQD
jgi:hypothetical protein